jgi:CRISPR-associated protein Csx14
MTYPEPTFSVKVDESNPGQFFACCGLLELAHRRWPGAEGWFDGDGFNIMLMEVGEGPFSKIIEHLRISKWQADRSEGVKSLHPIWCNDLIPRLDWWLRPDWHRFKEKPADTQPGLMKTSLKIWSGRQSPLKIASQLLAALNDSRISASVDLFDFSVYLTGRYGVDPRAAWNALDVGFSPDAQAMKVDTYPAVEMLAAIGLQRFRPIPEPEKQDILRYATWRVPLVPSVAAAACGSLLPGKLIREWRFPINDRGSYKGFGFALPVGD